MCARMCHSLLDKPVEFVNDSISCRMNAKKGRRKSKKEESRWHPQEEFNDSLSMELSVKNS